MTISFAAEVIPLVTDPDGVIRVGNTRVSFDTVVGAFSDGATPEEIVQQYPSLKLADVYQVIGYYLRRTSEFETYLRGRKAEAENIRIQNETRFDPQGIRNRLLARASKASKEQ